MLNVRFAVLGLILFSAVAALPAAPAAGSMRAAARALEGVPAWFEPNQGLYTGKVKYYSRSAGYALFLEESGAVLSLRDESSSATVGIALVGGNPKPAIEALDPLRSRTDYFLGNQPGKWRRNVPHFARVQYRNAYPGIDLVYLGAGQQLEYDFVVSPGADPASIRLRFSGADSIRLDPSGALVLSVGGRELRQSRPVVYQEIGNPGARRRVNVEARYVFARNREVRFALGAYDRTAPLVIDPVLAYAGYFGGGLYDLPTGLAVDKQGNVWLTGTTLSTVEPPQTNEAYAASRKGYYDVFAAKLSIQPSGQPVLLYWTYIGGSVSDYGGQIVIDDAGSVYLTGSTLSTDFPVTDNALQTKVGGGQDAFAVKLNPEASGADSLLYGTYLGGSGLDSPTAMAVDANGSIIVTGYTGSGDIAWITDQALQPEKRIGWDAFVLKFSPYAAAGEAAQFATYLGGDGTDAATGVALDASGAIYVSGYTMAWNFPVTGDAYLSRLNSSCNLFVAKLDPSATGLNALVYATYLGGGGTDVSTAMTVDKAGGVWLTGYTLSSDFPVTPDAYRTTFAGGVTDAFVTRLDPSRPPAEAITYSTFFGGQGTDVSYGLALVGTGQVAIAGYTFSNDLPVKGATTAGQSKSLNADAFVALLDTTLSGPDALMYATYFGGARADTATKIALDSSGGIYVAGYTGSKDLPVTDGSQKPSPSGGTSGFLLKLDTGSGELSSENSDESSSETPGLLSGRHYSEEILHGLTRTLGGANSNSR